MFNLRPVVAEDLAQIRQRLANGHYVLTQLEWWSLEDSIGSPAFLAAVSAGCIEGVSLALCDNAPLGNGGPVAWWRALAIKDTWDVLDFLRAALDPTLAGLRQMGASALTCMAFYTWLERALPGLEFELLTRVVTLRKDDRHRPAVKQRDVIIRQARPSDLDGVFEVDRAAFNPTWQYGQRTLSRMQRKMSRMIVAEQDRVMLGYGCGEMGRFSAHIVRLAVHPAYHGRQVGALLLDDLIRSFLAAGAQAITLNTQVDNVLSQRLYRRFNFRPVGEPVNAWQRAI
ncbi:MAG: GNAT family N-acetyltransferase [Thermoflexales bacterium]|nr:GNAT family N-acetyltransferase [Thermoflexales bacterium]